MHIRTEAPAYILPIISELSLTELGFEYQTLQVATGYHWLHHHEPEPDYLYDLQVRLDSSFNLDGMRLSRQPNLHTALAKTIEPERVLLRNRGELMLTLAAWGVESAREFARQYKIDLLLVQE